MAKKPLFSTGEIVIIMSPKNIELNGTEAKVLEVYPSQEYPVLENCGEGGCKASFGYDLTVAFPKKGVDKRSKIEDYCWCQCELRKKPPEQGLLGFEDLMKKLNQPIKEELDV